MIRWWIHNLVAHPLLVLCPPLRVRRHPPAGGTIDAKQARMTFREEHWFSDLRHLGSDRKWHLFERPDVEAARAARSGNDRDPLAEIRSHATKD